MFADPASDNKAVVGQLFVIGKTNRCRSETGARSATVGEDDER